MGVINERQKEDRGMSSAMMALLLRKTGKQKEKWGQSIGW